MHGICRRRAVLYCTHLEYAFHSLVRVMCHGELKDSKMCCRLLCFCAMVRQAVERPVILISLIRDQLAGTPGCVFPCCDPAAARLGSGGCSPRCNGGRWHMLRRLRILKLSLPRT